MGTLANVEIALDTKLASIGGLPPIAWSNTEYTPIEGASFIRPTLLPTETALFTLNSGQKYQGIYQIDIFIPVGLGVKPIYDAADAIRTGFQSNLSLVANSQTTFIQNITFNKLQREKSWYGAYVQIIYFSLST